MNTIIVVGAGNHAKNEMETLLHHPALAGRTVVFAQDVSQDEIKQKLNEVETLHTIKIHPRLTEIAMPTMFELQLSEKNNYITGKKLPKRNRR